MQGAWICTFFPTKKVIDDLLLSLHGPESQCSLELHIYYLLYSAPLLPELVIFPVNHVQWKQNKLVIWAREVCSTPDSECFGVIMESFQNSLGFGF